MEGNELKVDWAKISECVTSVQNLTPVFNVQQRALLKRLAKTEGNLPLPFSVVGTKSPDGKYEISWGKTLLQELKDFLPMEVEIPVILAETATESSAIAKGIRRDLGLLLLLSQKCQRRMLVELANYVGAQQNLEVYLKNFFSEEPGGKKKPGRIKLASILKAMGLARRTALVAARIINLGSEENMDAWVSGRPIKNLASDNPRRAKQIVRKVEQLLEAGKLEDARKLLTSTLSLQTKAAPLLRYTLGEVYRRMDQFSNAERYFQEAEHPGYSQPYVGLGLIAESRNDLDMAKKHFTKAVELNPSELNLYVNLARVLSKGGEHKEAERKLEQAQHIAKSSPHPTHLCEVYANLAKVQIQLDEYDQAWTSASKSIEENSEMAEPYCCCGIICLHRHSQAKNSGNANKARQELEKGIGNFEKATQLKPDYFRAHFYLGSAYIKRRDFDSAQKVLNFLRSRDEELFHKLDTLFRKAKEEGTRP